MQCGAPMQRTACERVRAAAWVVEDRFGGEPENPRHIDLYIGEEDREDFEHTDPYYFHAWGATVQRL